MDLEDTPPHGTYEPVGAGRKAKISVHLMQRWTWAQIAAFVSLVCIGAIVLFYLIDLRPVLELMTEDSATGFIGVNQPSPLVQWHVGGAVKADGGVLSPSFTIGDDSHLLIEQNGTLNIYALGNVTILNGRPQWNGPTLGMSMGPDGGVTIASLRVNSTISAGAPANYTDVNIAGTLSVAGLSTLHTTIILGNLNATGLTGLGNTIVQGTLTVTGVSTFQTNVIVAQNGLSVISGGINLAAGSIVIQRAQDQIQSAGPITGNNGVYVTYTGSPTNKGLFVGLSGSLAPSGGDIVALGQTYSSGVFVSALGANTGLFVGTFTTGKAQMPTGGSGHITGDLTVDGTFTNPSSQQIKTGIIPLSFSTARAVVMGITAQTYNYTDGFQRAHNFTQGSLIKAGFIAENVANATVGFFKITSTDSIPTDINQTTTLPTLAKDEMNPFLWAHVQNLTLTIDILVRQIKQLSVCTSCALT